MDTDIPFSSEAYWESRYRAGGTSGMGSVGRLAQFKAAAVNQFIAANGITSVIDFGCGDASQLALLELPGSTMSEWTCPRRPWRVAPRSFQDGNSSCRTSCGPISPADLTLALDVIYHLIEDPMFATTMRTLFAWATRFVVIYASNVDAASPSPHVRHRRFTDHVVAAEPDWRLLAHLPNPYPFDPADPDETSFADFFIYGRRNAPCSIVVPAHT